MADINVEQLIEKLAKFELLKMKQSEYTKAYHKRTGYATMKKWRLEQDDNEFKERRKVANAKYNEKQKQKKKEAHLEEVRKCECCNGLGRVYLGDDDWEWCDGCNYKCIQRNVPCGN